MTDQNQAAKDPKEPEEQIRARILSSAYELFRKKGIQHVTMDDVARTLGMSKKTLYDYFTGKSEILYQALEERIERGEEIRKKLLQDAPDVIEGMITLMLWQIGELEKVNPILFVEIERYYPDTSWLIRKNREVDNYRQVISLVQRGIEEGLFLKELDKDIVSRLLLVQLDHMSNYDLFPLSSYPRTKLFRHIFVHFIRGIVTEEGRKVLARTMDHLAENKYTPSISSKN